MLQQDVAHYGRPGSSAAGVGTADRWTAWVNCLLPVILITAFIVFWGNRASTLVQIRAEDRVDYKSELVEEAPAILMYASLCLYVLIAALVARGFLGRMHGRLPASSFLLYLGMWMSSVLLLVALSSDPTLYLTKLSAISSKLAPGSILAIGLFFVSADRSVWSHIARWLVVMAYVAVGFWVYGCLQMEQASRALALRWIWAPAHVLEVIAILPLAWFSSRSWAWRLVGSLPLLVLFASAFLQQTRLVLLTCVVQLLVYGVVRLRSGDLDPTRQRGLWTTVGIALAPVLALAFVYLVAAGSQFDGSVLGDSIGSFNERLRDDTRTHQYVDGPFFDHLRESLPLGAGYPALGDYTGEGMDGIDNGYLNSLYVTGIPMMICFLGLLIVPVVRSIRLKLAPVDAAVVAGAIAYAFRMGSSTVPNLEVHFILFILLAGRCAWLVSQAHRRVSCDEEDSAENQEPLSP